MLGVLGVCHEGTHGVVATGEDVGVGVGRIVDGGSDALEGVAVVGVYAEGVCDVGDEDLVLLHLALLRRRADVVVHDGELRTDLQLRAVGGALIDQHVRAAHVLLHDHLLLVHFVVEGIFVSLGIAVLFYAAAARQLAGMVGEYLL